MTTPTINHTVTVTMAGADVSAYVMKDSLYCRLSIGNKGDSGSFTLRDETGDITPLDWDEVVISVNGTPVFGGYVNSRRATGVGDGSNKEARWAVECRDYASLLDKVIVQRGYADDADVDIISDLFGTYLPYEGFDAATNAYTVDSDVDIYFDNITLREALNRLATTAGAAWFIAPDKSIYWYDPVAPGAAAFDVDVVTPNNTSSFDVLAGSLTYGTDATAIVNKIRVIGGEEVGAKVSDVFVANGTQDTFGPLTYKPGTFVGITYWVDDGGTVKRFQYPSFIGYESEGATLAVNGGDYEVIVNLETRFVTITEGDGNKPKNLTNVTVEYLPLLPVDVTVEDLQSQSVYNRIFDQTVYDESLTSTALATDYANQVIDEYAFGRETISFSVTEHGLLPGKVMAVTAPVFDVDYFNADALLLEDGHSALLLESGDRLMLESTGTARKFLIQEVTIRATVTHSNEFMIIATVSAGKYIQTLFDSLLEIRQFAGASGAIPGNARHGSLSQISGNIGEIVAGRAVFTDGGVGPFSWSSYNGHSGVVVGLEDTGTVPYGALYILDSGDVTTKIGRMNGLSAVGGVTPTGWGIWTENGYFSGVVAASQLVGGTITGGYISGGTVSGGYVTGGTVNGARITGGSIVGNTIIGGTIASGTPPINSSNTGVYMDSTGLYGYGSAGLTFRLASDPTIKPYFSSGTITNAVYEVTTQAVIRTGTTNPRVQIDNSGIFAYNSGGTLKFSVDATTGLMTATGGSFSGTVSASTFTGGTITGGTITGGYISGGTVSGGIVAGGTVSASYINGGTINSTIFTGHTFSGESIVGGTISGAKVTGGTITGGTITGQYISGGTINAATLLGSVAGADFISAAQVAVGTVSRAGGTASAIGRPGLGFRYLYMADSNDNCWKVEVSILGNLTVSGPV